jgi:endonuclease/exonuclease/phosphatase (EEP) superfamily protein YafD
MIISKSPKTADAPRAVSAPRPKRRGFLVWITFWLSIIYIVLLLADAVLIRNYGDRWWPATVLMFAPRWIMALPAILLAPMALLKDRRSLITLGIAAVLVAWPIMGLKLSGRGDCDGTTPLRVLTCNIHRNQLDATAFKAMLDDLKPDIVALQDWTSAHEAELFGGGGWYYRRDAELFLASRYPIINAGPIALDEPPKPQFKIREGAAVCYYLESPAGPINLINLHLSSPHESLQALRELETDAPQQVEFNSHARELESASLERFLHGVNGAVVILGDFNTPGESDIYGRHWDQFSDAFNLRGFGFGMTHVSTSSSVRIDHILLGSGWDVSRCWLGPAAGSPHRPLMADIYRTDAAPSPVASLEP